MKKIYEKPSVEVVDVELESLLAASDPNYDNGDVQVPTAPGEQAPEGAGGAKEHNGFWE